MSGVEELREVMALLAAYDAALAVLNATPEWEPPRGWDLAEEWDRMPDDHPEAIAQRATRESHAAAIRAALAWLRTHAPALLERIAALEADSARLDWLAANVLGVPWTHPSGQGCRVTFDVAKDCRVTVYEPRQPTADELRADLDAAKVGG